VRPRAEQEHGAGDAALRCSRCGRSVGATRHTRIGWTIGHYALHTGRTEEATLTRRDDEGVIVYRRLVAPALVVSCPDCFPSPEVQRLWAAFGQADDAG
jgi:hypothetical protein